MHTRTNKNKKYPKERTHRKIHTCNYKQKNTQKNMDRNTVKDFKERRKSHTQK